MGKTERQARYKTTGGAADLIKIETLVPLAYRERLLDIAKSFREEHRRGKEETAAIVAKVREASASQPKRYRSLPDIDRIVVTSVNVPFPYGIDAETLVNGLVANTVPRKFAGHFGRFLGELSLTDILRFCDRHEIAASTLSRFVRKQGRRLALRRPDLDEHLHALSHS